MQLAPVGVNQQLRQLARSVSPNSSAAAAQGCGGCQQAAADTLAPTIPTAAP
jgi:hypothetical protein